MGISPSIFESAGQRTEHVVPGVFSRSNNISSSGGVSAGNHVILGKSTGGEPLKLLQFSGLDEAKEALVGGELLTAVGHAFNCSPDYVPQRVFAMRVNTGEQSSITLKSGVTNLLKVQSWDWGSHTNQLKLWITGGTAENSKKITVAFKDTETVIDSIKRPSLSIQYTGVGNNPTLSISKSALKVSATGTGGETPAVIDELDVLFDDYATIEDLVARINDSGVYTAVALDTAQNAATNELDTISGTAIDESTTLYSNFHAVIDALKSVPFIGGIEVLTDSQRLVPENSTGYLYFAGGTAGDYTVSQWNDVLDALEKEDIQIISTPSTDQNVQTLICAHCVLMCSTAKRRERTFIVGGPLGESDEAALQKARAFNTKAGSYVTDCCIASDPFSGETVTLSASYTAIKLAAMESAMAVNEPLTNKQLSVLGFVVTRTDGSIEKLLKGGVLVCNVTDEKLNACIRSVTTFQGNNDLISCERSMVREDLYMNRDIRNRFGTGIGRPSGSSTSDIVSVLKQAAEEWQTNGYIVKSNAGENVWNIKVRISGDTVYLTYSRFLTAPRNFVFITANNYVYESTVVIG